jgi:hypothetical protein
MLYSMERKIKKENDEGAFSRACVSDVMMQVLLIPILIVVVAIVDVRTGRSLLADWALVSIIAIPAVVIIIALAVISGRKLKISARASKNGSGNIELS